MEVNFDKQIDTILRDLAKGDAFAESPPVSHLDADELSAFAENVLPQKARLRAMEHLADCSKCRNILSTFVSLNVEAESETVHEEVKTIAAIPETPWYRRLFAFPSLSYLMGAMALILVGTIGIILWQNGQDSQLNVAKNEESVTEKVKGPSGVSSDGEAPASEVYSANKAANAVAQPTVNAVANSNSSVTVSNTTLTDPPKPIATPASVGSANTATGSGPTLSDTKKVESDAPPVVAKEDVASKGGEGKRAGNEPETYATPASRAQTEENLAGQRVETQTQNRAVQNTIIYPDGESRDARRNAPPAPAPAKKAAPRESQVADDKDENEKNKVEAKPTAYKDVAGKSFRSEKGIWTDTAYKGGSLTNIRRGTDEYKKLDSGLRSTADYLGGTVIIVWKGKNYKIQ